MSQPQRFHSFQGPLRVHPANGRYFTDDGGRAVYLTGSHTWANFQDLLYGETGPLDYTAYLDFMQEYGHNFMRLWMWEQATGVPWSENRVVLDPVPYARTGPGAALDGLPKFNLDRWNDAFFERLRRRIEEAGRRGIYVSIMMFQGWSINKPWLKGKPWHGHPFHPENNVNGDSNVDGLADVHSLEVPAVTARQEAFVRKVIETVNDLDNVLYEIINEPANDPRTLAWHYHMIEVIHRIQEGMPKRHPVGMTAIGHTENNALLFAGAAEWISPGQGEQEEYKFDPPASDGSKVILSDTDHLWGLGGTYRWVWKTFMRGMNPIFMDPWCPQPELDDERNFVEYPDWELLRRGLGYTRRLAQTVDLAAMAPRNELASSSYCLADPGRQYLMYTPEPGVVEVDLRGAEGEFAAEWMNALDGTTRNGDPVRGGEVVRLASPFERDAVLRLFLRQGDRDD